MAEQAQVSEQQTLSQLSSIRLPALLGGRICLDFCNSITQHADQPYHELLRSYADLATWSAYAGSITQAESESLIKAASDQSGQASSVLTQALTLRKTLYTVFTAIVDGQPVPQQEVKHLNDFNRTALAHLTLVRQDSGFDWQWDDAHQLEYPLWSVIRSASDVLTSVELDRVRQCSGCGWLFLDQSRNRSRTWCDMQFCGNRAKARRYYERRTAVEKTAVEKSKSEV